MVEDLDTLWILEGYSEERGYPPYHPVMMTALLLYSDCQRLYSADLVTAKALLDSLR